jgi:hypothetical protein
MTSGYIGSPSGNVIVPVANLQKRSKTLTITSYITQSAWTCQWGYATFSADSAGVWRVHLDFYIKKDSGSATADSVFTIAGMTFADVNGGQQAGSCIASETAVGYKAILFCRADDNAGTIGVGLGGATNYGNVMVNQSFLLAGEPTWASLGTTAAAALEGSQQIAAYIPSASATSAGLLSYYAEGTFTVYCVDGTNKSAGGTVRYIRSANVVTMYIPEVVLKSTATARYLTTTDAAGTTTWPAALTPATLTYVASPVRTGDAAYAMCLVCIRNNGTVNVYGDLAANGFNSNNENKGIFYTTISYLLT